MVNLQTTSSKIICIHCKRKVRKFTKYLCGTCWWKNNYFGGLYWKAIKKKCKKCGRSDMRLNLDHINDNPKDNCLENLQTLCVECHMKKRLFYCLYCKESKRAISANQVRCIECGKRHEQKMSFIRQSRYWKTRKLSRYNWYINRLKQLI